MVVLPDDKWTTPDADSDSIYSQSDYLQAWRLTLTDSVDSLMDSDYLTNSTAYPIQICVGRMFDGACC